MIRNFRHRGLKRLFEDDDRSKLDAQDADKIARILARLSRSRVPQDMAAPGFRLHPLKGDRRGFWGGDRSGKLAHHLPFRGRGRLRR